MCLKNYKSLVLHLKITDGDITDLLQRAEMELDEELRKEMEEGATSQTFSRKKQH